MKRMLWITGIAVFHIILLTVPTPTSAHPFGDYGLQVSLMVIAPSSGYSLSYFEESPPVAIVSTTGDGIAGGSEPQVVTSSNSIAIETDGSVTTTGPGSASARFGEMLSVVITNTSSVDVTFTTVPFAQWAVNSHALPPNERLNFGFSLDGVSIQRVACNLPAGEFHNPRNDDPGLACNWGGIYGADEEFGGFGNVFLPAGGSYGYSLFMSGTFSVVEAPEPSSLMLLATILGVGLCLSTATSRQPR